MSLRKSTARRLLPFGLPLSLGLLMTVWLVQQDGQPNGPSHTEAKSSNQGRPLPRATKAASLLDERDAARMPQTIAASDLPLAPPASPRVADLLTRLERGSRTLAKDAVAGLAAHQHGQRVSFIAGDLEWHGVIDSRLEQNGMLHIGVHLDDELGRFQISIRNDDRIQAQLFFNGESRALAFSGHPDDRGLWAMQSTTVDQILCVPAGTVYPPAALNGALTPLAEEAPTQPANPAAAQGPISNLSSNPQSTFVLYCDFDGETVTHPLWNKGQTINAQPHPRANDEAFVERVWRRVSEDYAGFDINVTTDRAIFDAAAVSRRVHCVITPTNTAAPGAGGVAYLNTFGQDVPCWAFNLGEGSCADTISHEVGHTLGLRHDGTTEGVEYYGGQGTGPTSWAPIMGAYFAERTPPFVNEAVTQWSKGEYPKANNKEDDLNIITTRNGFGYRKDDAGNNRASARPLAFNTSAKIEDSGIIERASDTDWFSFYAGDGPVNLDIKALDIQSPDFEPRGANLAISASLYDSKGRLIVRSNPSDTLDASIRTTATAGQYYLAIDGAGRGSLSTGFSDYASIGKYAISGSLELSGTINLSYASRNFAGMGGSYSFRVMSDVPWTWSTDQAWVVSNEATTQVGDQVFEYSVDPNNEAASRTAIITFRSGFLEAKHTIVQKSIAEDDYGDDIDSAFPIPENASTPGAIEKQGDIDVFRVDVSDYGILTIRTEGGTDTFGELLDNSGKRLKSDDSTDNPNFRITRQVTPGRYHVFVRHGIDNGTGAYTLITGFERAPVISATPSSLVVLPKGGSFDINVIANQQWSWSVDAAWVSSGAAATQYGGQTLTFEVAPYQNNESRAARITLQPAAGGGPFVITITQNGRLVDDHGDTAATATNLNPGDSKPGSIDAAQDIDFFRIVLPTSGKLTLGSVGSIDTYGELYDAKGRRLAANDDLGDENFGITRDLGAGTYFLKVRHFLTDGLGDYRVRSFFSRSSFVTLRYAAARGGSIRGPARQSVKFGGNGKAVTASPKPGYSFAGWSDGKKSSKRSDLNLNSHVNVTARFVRRIAVNVEGGAALTHGQLPPLDFGTLKPGDKRRVSFTVTNDGKGELRRLRATKTGPDAALWNLGEFSRKSLKPGQSATFSASFKPTKLGKRFAIIELVADDGAAFTIHVRGTASASAASSSLRALANSSGEPGTATLSATTPDPTGLGNPLSTAPLASIARAAASQWIAASPDGLFRYLYDHTEDSAAIPSFLISVDGDLWQAANLLSFSRYSRLQSEALIAPPLPGIPFLLIAEEEQPRTGLRQSLTP